MAPQTFQATTDRALLTTELSDGQRRLLRDAVVAILEATDDLHAEIQLAMDGDVLLRLLELCKVCERRLQAVTNAALAKLEVS